jgi:hypothetical protein
MTRARRLYLAFEPDNRMAATPALFVDRVRRSPKFGLPINAIIVSICDPKATCGGIGQS